MSENASSDGDAATNPAPTDAPSSQSETGSRPSLSSFDLNLPPSARRYERDPDIIVMPLEDVFLLPSILPPRPDIPTPPPRAPRPRPQPQQQRPAPRSTPPPRPPSRPPLLEQLQDLDSTNQAALLLLLACMGRPEATAAAPAPK